MVYDTKKEHFQEPNGNNKELDKLFSGFLSMNSSQFKNCTYQNHKRRNEGKQEKLNEGYDG